VLTPPPLVVEQEVMRILPAEGLDSQPLSHLDFYPDGPATEWFCWPPPGGILTRLLPSHLMSHALVNSVPSSLCTFLAWRAVQPHGGQNQQPLAGHAAAVAPM
jgi:hypothetical protein